MVKSWYRRWLHPLPAPAGPSLHARADAGEPQAQYLLGLKAAEVGNGVPDFAEAARWHRAAAQQAHPGAQYQLGLLYAAGQGLPKDLGEATAWFSRAALQGDSGAQYQLGMQQHRASYHGPADAVSEARMEAFKWYRLAAAQGCRYSPAACDTLMLAMSCAEVAEATRRLDFFIAGKNPPGSSR